MSSKSVQIIGGENREHAYVDSIHNGLVSTEERHSKTHEGRVYTVSHLDQAILKDESTFYAGTIPPGWEAHVKVTASASGAAILRIWEDPTSLVGGVAASVSTNRKRSVTTDSDVTAEDQITAFAGGTLLFELFLPGAFSSFGPGTIFAPEQEWVFAPGTEILFEIENLTTKDGMIGSLVLDFYEVAL